MCCSESKGEERAQCGSVLLISLAATPSTPRPGDVDLQLIIGSYIAMSALLTYTDFIMKVEVFLCDSDRVTSLSLILEYMLTHSRYLNHIIGMSVLVLLCLLMTNVCHSPLIR